MKVAHAKLCLFMKNRHTFLYCQIVFPKVYFRKGSQGCLFKFCSIFFTGNFTGENRDNGSFVTSSPVVSPVGATTGTSVTTTDNSVTTLVVLSGNPVVMTCPFQTLKMYWYYFNQTVGEYHIVGIGPNLAFEATVDSSGQYLCNDETKPQTSSHTFNLTVVGKCVLP